MRQISTVCSCFSARFLQTTPPDHTIVNRTIRVHSKEHDEFFLGEVTGYDPSNGQHSVLYRQDMNEVWEDLRKEKWMILNEQLDTSEHMIAKKLKQPVSPSSSRLLQAAERLHGLEHGQGPSQMKHYLYVQTPVKEAMFAKHLLERCQRNCGVVITIEQFSRPPLPPQGDEDAEKYAALDQSKDGRVWKLSITGSDVSKAYSILEKNKLYFEDKLAGGNSSVLMPTSLAAQASAASIGTLASSASTGAAGIAPAGEHEIIFPRPIVDAVKRRLPSLKEKYSRSNAVQISMAPSESKSKRFSRLVLEGASLPDLLVVQEQVWNVLIQLCAEAQLPLAKNEVPCNLGLLGGSLSAEQFKLLCSCGNSGDGSTERAKKVDLSSSVDACEDFRRRFPFFRSFETTYMCTIWVQSDEDKGRINSSHQVVTATPDSPRKVFLGCKAPGDVQRLFSLLQQRAADLERGVKFLYLGRDRVYQPLMMSRQFFGFVQRLTGATVQTDTMTNDHLRMDGRKQPHVLGTANTIDLTVPSASVKEEDRAALAEELVRLQIELYRDHCIREQRWIFGRDWTIVAGTDASKSSSDSASVTAESTSSSLGRLDAKSAAQEAYEIPGVVDNLGHGRSVAAHAAVILYRFVSAVEETQLRAREAVIASIFLANKCQKANKAKRLEGVLEAAYETFYPGSKFDKDNESVLVLAKKVILAEKEILQTLEYDIFWRDVEWISSAASGGGRMNYAAVVEVVEKFAFSGPVVSAGPELWLKYGVEYVFAASAAFMEANLDHLLPSLSVIPLKVLAAAELLAKSARFTRSSGKKLPLHYLLEGRDRLEKCIPRVREACMAAMNKMTKNGPFVPMTGASLAEQRYKMISRSGRKRYAIHRVPRQFVKDNVVPIIDAVAAESSCIVYIGESSDRGTEIITFDGPWRAVAVAEHLVRTRAGGPVDLPRASDSSAANGTKIQAKLLPGCADASDIQTLEGWEGTLQSKMSNIEVKNRRLGGKSCVAGKISESALLKSGLRWWIPLENGSSPSGSINDMFLVRYDETESFNVIGKLANAVSGRSNAFPKLSSLANEVQHRSRERFTAVSLQQWPTEKIGIKESEKESSKKNSMGIGFSQAALQEMQLLTQLHGVISLPFGHPNFVLPVGIAVASDEERKGSSSPTDEKDDDPTDPMFSLFRSNEENEKVAEKDKKVKRKPHLLLHPTPFILNRFMSKKSLGGADLRSNKAVIASWFHDLLSVLVHCHSNHVLLRTIQSDQIVVDHNGTAKYGGLYRCTVLSKDDREETSSSQPMWKAARAASKTLKKKGADEDFSNNPFVAPEILLGSPKHTTESDVWAMGALLANLLMGKPLFSGKDRITLLTSQFKVVGTPARDNFEEAVKFPHFTKVPKKYIRGVEKALRHILKDEGDQHAKAASLIARMLHLDPKKRCSASEALSHEYMIEYLENCATPAFRDEYVEQWMRLKERTLSGPSSGGGGSSSGSSSRKDSKRKAMLMAARSSAGADNDVDDLYDIDDLMDQPSAKKGKHSA